jgi:hypothetical protein
MAKNKKLKLTVNDTVTKDSSGVHKKPNGTVNAASHIVILKQGGTLTAEVVSTAPLVKGKGPLKQEYDWLCNVVQTMNFKASDAIGWTAPAVTFLFPKVIEGGGMVWLEAFEKGTEPTNSLKEGYLIAAKGKPAILSAIWREYSPKNDGKDITKTGRKFGDTVQLHIYTEALFGQDIEITLMDDDLASADDNLAPIPRTDGKPEYDKDKKTPKITLKQFTREVKIYSMLEDERSRPDSIQISDFVQEEKAGAAKTAGVITRINKTQKVVLDVFIDDFWKPTAGETLTIYPVVKIISQPNAKEVPLYRDYITIAGDINKETALTKVGNKPVIVGDIPTNPKRFDPCKYTMIKVKDKDGDWPVFDENVLEYTEGNQLVFEVIAGEENAKQTITLKLIDFTSNNDECKGNPKHKGHSILYQSLIDAGYKAETEKSKRPEEDDSIIKTKSSSGTNTVLDGGFKRKNDNSKSYTKIISHSDTELVFDAMYKYSLKKADGSFDWERIWGYFWLPSVKTDTYPVITQSCRWRHEVDFKIYPDIKWSLVFGFNVKKEQLEALFPSWCDEKKVKKYEKIGRRVTRRMDRQLDKIAPKTISKNKQEEISKGMLKSFTNTYGKPEDAVKEDKPVKGKLSTLVDILKEVEISLKSEYNAGQNEVDITDKFVKSVFDKMGGFLDLAKKAVEIVEGKYDPSPSAGEAERSLNDFISKEGLKSKYEHLTKALKRPPQEVEILYPKVEFSASWQYEPVDGEHYPKLKNRKGLGIALTLKAEPLIGMQIKWHILDLLARRHPIAYAVLAAVKTLLTIIGDNPDGVKVDFWVKGTIAADITYQHNLLSGPKEVAAKGTATIEAGVELDITAKGVIVQGSYEAVAELGLGGSAQVSMGVVMSLGADYDGFYTEASLKFEGIKLKFKAVAEASLNKLSKSKKGELEREKIISSGGKIEGEIALAEHTFKTDKLYFKKFGDDED